MTNPNQRDRQDRGTGQVQQDERQRSQQQGGRQQPDVPASTPRTDRDPSENNPNRNRTDMGDRTDVETDQPMRKGNRQGQDR
ncbi:MULTISPECIES: hypothetical protein [Nannocystis]|uniref:Uncharacterized protein n=1 Tax=Nannocystis radixulma TaxID=2995305 RepID=A0ABT5BM21_9BACT|nr:MULTISPECIES: hypothetical protein [Nannocystis]MCY1058122.1 hypothetical protein [Nannocystis sp. SCPEA4]MDC0675210.1 hypothetical protein [Nannocystis radixulma]